MSRAKQHQRTRSLYAKYGEGYNPTLPYQSKAFKISRYGQLVTTRPLPRTGKEKRDLHQKIKRFVEGEHAVPPTLALYGASITQGLRRYHEVWDTYFAPLGAINLGIGGDRTQHVLERVEDMQLPATRRWCNKQRIFRIPEWFKTEKLHIHLSSLMDGSRLWLSLVE